MKNKSTAVQSIIRQISAYGFNNFVDATKTYLKVLDPESAEHVILEYLLTSAVGQENAKNWTAINRHLKARNIKMTKNKWQTDYLQLSRRSMHYVGSSHAGYFIFGKQSDVEATIKFYLQRIAKEEEHLRSLIFAASKANFPPPETDPAEEEQLSPLSPDLQGPPSESGETWSAFRACPS